jgi:hypothetical protein
MGSLESQRIELVKPVFPREEVLDGYAQFHLSESIKKFED